jgi:enoyl-CoA hydratase/carnithine racemase
MQETERDRYMSAEEAKDYGLIDEVLQEEDKDRKASGQEPKKEDENKKDEPPAPQGA